MSKNSIIKILVCIILVLFMAACTDDKSNNIESSINNGQSSSDITQDKNNDVPVNNNDPIIPDNDENNTSIDKPDPGLEPDPKPDPIPLPTPDVPDGNMNPLTGLYDGISDQALNHKPVAIMLGNSLSGLPQWGIGNADIIYEMIAEGRITRLMAIFQDYTKIEKIASIRSARPYFIDIAQSYGAIFVHFGASEPAVEQIAKREDLIDVDGIKWPMEEIAFFRDPERKATIGSEHSVYTSGELLKLAFDRQKKSLEQSEHPSAFNFGDKSSAENGTPMTKVQVTFKSTHKPYFIYDSKIGEYLRYQYNDEHIDGLTNEQISVKNVFVLRMNLQDIDHYLDIVDIKTTGTGSGYYFCEGKYIDITWKKDTYNSPIEFYTQDGSELICMPGQTFISVVTESSAVEIE